MPKIANFEHFCLEPFELRDHSSHTLTQTIDADPKGGEGGLLTWNVRGRGGHTQEYDVFLNGRKEGETFTLNGSMDWFSVQQAVHTNHIEQGENTIRFEHKRGDPLSIGSVVLFYRQRV